jgi:CDP-diacylglycerol--serine O-phosphatidyltransferase
MNIKKHIPNAITCCNLLCGCLAIVQVFEGNLVYAAYLVGLAAIFDFFDGFAARMLKVSSPIGKDLDSLADMVTFGVVPGLFVFKILISLETISRQYNYLYDTYFWFNYLAFSIIIFSAIRLAKFNNDTRQSESFIGLPTPANAIFWCFLFINDSSLAVPNIFVSIISNPFSLMGLVFVFSYLLVSELPLFALKFKHFKWKGNEIRFIFLALSLLMLITLQFLGIPLIIILYVLLSLLTNYLAKRKVTTQ